MIGCNRVSTVAFWMMMHNGKLDRSAAQITNWSIFPHFMSWEMLQLLHNTHTMHAQDDLLHVWKCICSLCCLLPELMQPPYWSHYSKPRLWLHTVISSKYFDLAIASIISINVLTMAIEQFNMSTVGLENDFMLEHCKSVVNFDIK